MSNNLDNSVYIYNMRVWGVMDIVVGNTLATSVQILDNATCISHHVNFLEKGMNLAMGK